MKEKGTHEGCIEQIYRLFSRNLYASHKPATDEAGRIRLDDWEMAKDVQKAVMELWPMVNTENLKQLSDYESYRAEFLRLFGFGLSQVNYDADVNPLVGLELANVPQTV